MPAPYDISHIAEWFLYQGQSDETEVTPMKLQKLLYYAQGHYLGETGERLFTSEMEAWRHGPVSPRIYQEYKDFKREPITVTIDPEHVNFHFSGNDLGYLARVWHQYGHLSGSELRNMTHEEAPWINAWGRNPESAFDYGEEIMTIDEMRAYFSEHKLLGKIVQVMPAKDIQAFKAGEIPDDLLAEIENAEWGVIA